VKKLFVMTNLELKDDMLAMLAHMKERPTLIVLHRIMQNLFNGAPIEDWWDELSAEQQIDLKLALEEVKSSNNLVSNEEAMKTLAQWRMPNEQ
jgi:hypothetical protein